MIQFTARNSEQQDAVALLEDCGALLHGTFLLASGKESDYYFDSKELTLDPKGAHFVAKHLVKKLHEEGIKTVGGTAYSAIPIVSHICLFTELEEPYRPISAFYIRKESKGHGTDRLAEGKIPKADPGEVAIVEDVVTSGKSLLDAVAQAEKLGCKVKHTIALVDRNEGGRRAVEDKGYKFWALFDVRRTDDGQVEFKFNG